MNNSYFPAGWIANLGVEPLLLFAFFLFVPIFFFFKFLLVVVCCVFEDILKSFSYLIHFTNKAIFITFLILLVKTFVNDTYANAASGHDIFLSKGEQTELQIEPVINYSVGNKEIINYKYDAKQRRILLKAKSLGFTDLVLWQKSKKTTYRIYVTSKQEQLKRMEIIQVLKDVELETSISGDFIYVSGEIKTMKQYLLFLKIQGLKIKKLILNVKIGNELLSKIIADIYKDFYEEQNDYISCSEIKSKIECEYETKQNIDHFISKYKNLYQIEFRSKNKENKFRNYKVKFHIVSLTNSTTQTNSLGINKVKSNLMETISHHKMNLESGDILFENQNINAKLIAMPEINTIIGHPFTLELGGEVPYQNSTNDKNSTDWKFVGLRIKGDINFAESNYLLNQQSQFTQSSDQTISGPKSKSTLILTENKVFELFTIKLDFKEKQD